MTLEIKHAFVSGKADGVDMTLVQPSHWNAALSTSMATARILGRTTAGTGAIEELQITGTGKVVLDTSPNFTGPVGIGMTPSNILDITQTVNGSDARIQMVNAGTGNASTQLRLNNATHIFGLVMHGTGFGTTGVDRQDGARLYTDGAGGMTFDIPSDAFRFYIGGTAFYQQTSTNATFLTDVTAGHILLNGAGGGLVTLTGFGNTCTLDVDGSIYTNSGNGIDMQCVSAGVTLANGAASWAALSDYRAKNVSGAFTNSGTIIDAVPVHLAALKETPDKVKAMFLAHEVQAVVPYAVHGEKDGEKMQMLESTDPLVPILWAELRSLRERVAGLEDRITVLENS